MRHFSITSTLTNNKHDLRTPVAKKKLVYMWSLRNAAADRAGRFIGCRAAVRYMMSPLEYLAAQLNQTRLGDKFTLVGVIHDDDAESPRDRTRLADYGFAPNQARHWFFPLDTMVQGGRLSDLMVSLPSSYRQYAMDAPERVAGKHVFEQSVRNKLLELNADLVLLDGLLVILDKLVRPGSLFYRRIVNIHPGITRPDSPYEHRGAHATLDAFYAARGQKVIDWQTMQTCPAPPLFKTGASFHYVDNGIDSGEVITDVLNTDIDPQDSLLELRWNNFHDSLFPALIQGLEIIARTNSAPAVS